MILERAYNEGIFKGHRISSNDRKVQGHLVRGQGYYSLFIKGDFITHANSFREIKKIAIEKFNEMEKQK
jgi:hypothetical protein